MFLNWFTSYSVGYIFWAFLKKTIKALPWNVKMKVVRQLKYTQIPIQSKNEGSETAKIQNVNLRNKKRQVRQ